MSQKQTQAIDTETLIEALNDPRKAALLMAENGWDAADLIAQAERLTREMSAGIAAVNMV